MPTFSHYRESITPNTSNDNWTITAGTAGDLGKILAISWGGEATTSTAMATRWTRPSTNGTTPVAGVNEPHNGSYATPLLSTATSWTTQPTLVAASNLHSQSWNAHGGLGYIALPLASPWMVQNGVTGSDEVSCRNSTGTATSSYGLTWEE